MSAILQAIIVFVVTVVVTLVMVPVSKRIAFVLGAVDYPSNRRVNKEPVPRCGGIGLYCGFMVGLALLYVGTNYWGWDIHNTYYLQSLNYPLLFVGVTCMFILGLVDDINQIHAGVKFLFQIVAATVVAFSGVSIGSVYLFGCGFIDLGILDIPLTVLYLVIFVNIINLIDGLDGLAAGIVAICSIALMFLVLERGTVTLACVCVCLLASCLGFLRYNFNPASIFMGDSGSHFLGLMLGIISLAGVARMSSVVVLVVPIIIAGVPVIDTASAIVRRLLSHKSIGEPDLNHIHHRLLRVGLSHRATVLVLYAITAIMAIVAVLLDTMTGPVRSVATVVVIILGFVITIVLGAAGPVLQHYYEGRGKVGPRTPRDPVEYKTKIK